MAVLRKIFGTSIAIAVALTVSCLLYTSDGAATALSSRVTFGSLFGDRAITQAMVTVLIGHG